MHAIGTQGGEIGLVQDVMLMVAEATLCKPAHGC